MLNPTQRSRGALVVALVSLLLPSAAYAQAAITGVVRDASGAVLPGATVEAASPVLIEKVRSVVTDATGQYRIVDLRPGIYSVTFSLPGFTTVKREGIELSGSFVATVNADLRVGALEETITVTGESPIVDVQSTRSQQIIDKDVLAAIPSSRNVIGIQAIIPGMSTAGDDGGIAGTMQGGAATIHGGRANDSRIYADGINMGWAGSSGGGGQMPQVAASQEVVMTISGGLAEAETSGLVFNAVPREGANTFTGQFNFNGSNDSLQGSNYTEALQDCRPAGPVRADQRVRRQRHVRRPDCAGQAVVLRRLPPSRGRADGTGNVPEQERWQPECLDGGLRSIQAGLQQQPGAPGNDPADVAGHAAKQIQFPLGRAIQRRELRSGRWRRGAAHDAGSVKSSAVHPVASAHCQLAVADLGPLAGRGWLGHVSGPLPLRNAQRRDKQSGNDPAAGADRRAGLCRPGRLYPWPDLADATRARARRVYAFA